MTEMTVDEMVEGFMSRAENAEGLGVMLANKLTRSRTENMNLQNRVNELRSELKSTVDSLIQKEDELAKVVRKLGLQVRAEKAEARVVELESELLLSKYEDHEPVYPDDYPRDGGGKPL